MKGRWLLIAAAVLVFIGGVTLVAAVRWPERLADMCRNLAEGKGSFFLFGAGCALVLASAIWTTFRPKQSAAALAWSPLIGAIGLGTAAAWWPASAPDPSVAAIGIGKILEAVRLCAAGGTALVFASILSSFAAIAIARRARRASAPTTASRVIVVVLVGSVLSAVAILFAFAKGADRNIGILVMPLFATILAMASVSTVRSEDASRGDATLATFYALGALVLGVLGTILSTIGGMDLEGWGESDPGQLARIGSEMIHDAWRAGLVALLGIVPLAVLAPIALRMSGARTALRTAAIPFVPAIVAATICIFAARSTLAGIPAATNAFAWPVLAPELAEDDECGQVQPSNVVWLSHARLAIPGEKGEKKPPFDWGAAASALDAHDPSGDVWLAVDVDDAPFSDLGGLLDAIGRSRGPRGIGVSAGADDPFEGCAMHFVGKIGDGSLRCSDPIAIAAEGCIPEIPEEKTWHVTVSKPDDVRLEWRQGKVIITQIETTLDQLPAKVESQWTEQGWHRDLYDRRFDHAIVRVSPQLPLRDAMRALAAVRAPRRDIGASGGGWGRMGMMGSMGDNTYRPAHKSAVFKISFGTIAP